MSSTDKPALCPICEGELVVRLDEEGALVPWCYTCNDVVSAEEIKVKESPQEEEGLLLCSACGDPLEIIFTRDTKPLGFWCRTCDAFELEHKDKHADRLKAMLRACPVCYTDLRMKEKTVRVAVCRECGHTTSEEEAEARRAAIDEPHDGPAD